MAEFLETEATDVDSTSVENEGEYEVTVSDREFIDDDEDIQQEYPYFTNVTRTYNEVTNVDNVDNLDLEAGHYFDSDEEEDWHIFPNFEAKVILFKETLICPHGLENPDSFFYAILYAIRHKFTSKVDFLQDEDVLKRDVGLDLSNDLFKIKPSLRLDGQDVLNFENQCFQINTILSRHNMFLRVYELKNKFRYIIKQNSEQKKYFSEVSACVVERFNGFQIVRLEFDNEIRKEFTPLDIIYKPVIKLDSIINCYFTDRLHLAFKALYNETTNWTKPRSSCAFQCYFCGKFCVRANKWNKHMETCVGKPGFVYNFQTRNLLTYEENIKFKRDVPLTAYIDFETTAPTDCCLDPESNKMNVVSYVIILAFHPQLQLQRVIIERSFGHSLEKLCQIDYLTAEQLNYCDGITLKQLRDCALNVNKK